MFGGRSHGNELEVPSFAKQDPGAVEVLRPWASPGKPQQLALRTTWKSPAA